MNSVESINVPATKIIDEAMGHLGAACAQYIDSDDRIIREHVEKAYELLKLIHRSDQWGKR